MRAPPPLTEFVRFPVVGGTALLALGATLVWKSKSAALNMDVLTDGPEIAMGEYWRLVTSVLLHVDFFHLIFNLYWLWVLGSLVESVFGHFITLGIVLLLAVGSGAAEYGFMDGGVGLSGVGYGLFGMLWVLNRHDPRFEDAIDKNTSVLFVAWFFLCIVMTQMGTMQVANIAHGAGALFGALLGLAISGPAKWRILSGAGVVVLLVGSVLSATRFRPNLNVSSNRGLREGKLARQLLDAGDNQAAEKVYREALVYRPDEPSFWHNLGVALYREGRMDEYNAAIKREEELRPSSPEPDRHGDKSD